MRARERERDGRTAIERERERERRKVSGSKRGGGKFDPLPFPCSKPSPPIKSLRGV